MSDANQAEAIFHEARQLRGPARTALLDRACAKDATLRAIVDGLLRADEQAKSLPPPLWFYD